MIDTINRIMVSDEMRRSKEKGYDKWVDLAACVWDLVNEAYEYRDDLTSHLQPTPRQTMTKTVLFPIKTCKRTKHKYVEN